MRNSMHWSACSSNTTFFRLLKTRISEGRDLFNMSIKSKIQSYFPHLNDAYKYYKATKGLYSHPTYLPLYGLKMRGSAGHNWKDTLAGKYEAKEFLHMGQRLKYADMLIDIGANNGLYTLLACSLGKKVISFEPMPINLMYLYKNILDNHYEDNVEVYPLALSSETKINRIYGSFSWASLKYKQVDYSTIPAVRFDNLDLRRFDGKKIIIKIDVEGAEMSVLQGMMFFLEMQPKPEWLIEITDRERFDEICKLFETHCYTRKHIDQFNYYFYRRSEKET